MEEHVGHVHIKRFESLSEVAWSRPGRVALLVDGTDYGVFSALTMAGAVVDKTQLSNYLDEDALFDRPPAEGTRSVVAVGSGLLLDAAKLWASIHGLPLLLVPSDYHPSAATAAACFLTEKGTVACNTPIEVALIRPLLRPSRQSVSLLYASLVAAFVRIHSRLFANRFQAQEALNPALKEEMAKLEGVLLSTNEYADGLVEVLWEALLQAEKVLPLEPNDETLLLALMISIYKERKMPYNNYVMAAAYTLGSVVRLLPRLPNLCLPPERVGIWQDMDRVLGWHRGGKLPTAAEQIRYDHVWRDWQTDAKEQLQNLPTFARNWRRLVGPAGYGYFEDLAYADLVRLLPMVAEAVDTYSPLKHIYWRGLLPKTKPATKHA